MSATPSVVASIAALHDRWADLCEVTVVGVDLREEHWDWSAARTGHTMLLGCLLPPGAADQLAALGVGVFPALDGLPFDPYRAELYTYDELTRLVEETGAVGSAGATVDARISAWFASSANSVPDALIRAVHD